MGFLSLFLLGLGCLGLSIAGTTKLVEQQRFVIYLIPIVLFCFGAIGSALAFIRFVRKRFINKNAESEKDDERSAAKRKRRNIVLTITAVLCPFLFGLSYVGVIISAFMCEGRLNWWEFCFATLSMFFLLSAGLVGFISALTLVIVNRKQLKSVFAWFGLLLILLVNFGISLPVFSAANRYYHRNRYLDFIEFCPSFKERETGRYEMTHNDWNHIYAIQRPMRISFFRADVADIDMEHLTKNRYVREVRFEACPDITDQVVKGLAQIPRLKEISLGYNPQLKEIDFSSLGPRKKLKSLELYKNENLSAESLRSIGELFSLKELKLSECPQTDDTVLSKIAGLKNLRRLELTGCEKITDAGVAELAKLRHLKSLSIQNCPSVTSGGVSRIRRELPKCEISLNRPPRG